MTTGSSDSITPSRRVSFLFCLILGLLSVLIAEGVSGSDLIPLFHPWGMLVTTPLYLLHTVFLAGLLAMLRRTSWRSLCFAGAIFGLYEAYITKVLWNPSWSPELAYKIGGVAWPHFVMLVPWWHPFMAFIGPILLAEVFLTRDALFLHGLPERIRRALTTPRSRRRLATGVAVLFGVWVAMGHTPLLTLGAIAGNGAILFLVFWLWRRNGAHERYSMRDLLPGKRGLIVTGALLAVMYGVTGPFLLGERLPSWDGHVTIFACYAILIAFICLERAGGVPRDEAIADAFPAKSLKPLAWGLLAMFITARLILFLGPYRVILYLLTWGAAFIIGLPVYALAFWYTWRERARKVL